MLDLAWGYRPWSLSHPGQVFNLQIFCAVYVHRETTKGGKGYMSNHFFRRYNMAPTTSGNGVRKSWYHPGRWCEVPDYLLVPLGNFMSITEVPPAFAIWFWFGGKKTPNWKNWRMVFEPFWSDVGNCWEMSGNVGKCREMSGNLDLVIRIYLTDPIPRQSLLKAWDYLATHGPAGHRCQVGLLEIWNASNCHGDLVSHVLQVCDTGLIFQRVFPNSIIPPRGCLKF